MDDVSTVPALRPGEAGYAEACAAWNTNGDHHPARVVVAGRAADVVAAVRLARSAGLGVGVMATGHGTARPCDGTGVLVNTARMNAVHVDAVTRTARVGAGATWGDLARQAAPHGLTGLPGSSSRVGITGYTMGGGFGWLGRRYGLASRWVTGADVVTAGGELVRADAHEYPDLLWGLRGGGGNLGVVTALDLTLHPLTRVYAGNLYYPPDRATEVLEFFAAWSRTLPDAMSAAATFNNFPPFPTVPEQLRGRSLVAVRACWCGPDLRAGERLVDRARTALGPPAMDTFRALAATATDAISMDPVDPLGVYGHSETLPDLTPGAIAELVRLGPGSPLAMLEVRLVDGALTPRAGELSPLNRSGARFTVNALGPTPTPDRAARVHAHLAEVAARLRPHATGATYLNFCDLTSATPERIRAAYAAADHARLIALKDRYDPGNTFRFNRNVPPSGAGRASRSGTRGR